LTLQALLASASEAMIEDIHSITLTSRIYRLNSSVRALDDGAQRGNSDSLHSLSTHCSRQLRAHTNWTCSCSGNLALPWLLLATDNAFFKPLWSYSELDTSDLSVFRSRASMTSNPVYDMVNLPVNKKPHFKTVDVRTALHEMPSDLNRASIPKFNCGAYALRLAPKYLAHSGDLRLGWSKFKNQIILKVSCLVSRFSKTKKRTVFILTSSVTLDLYTYCSCKCGTRTIGSCAHGITSPYYFWAARDQLAPPTPGSLFSSVRDLSEFSKPRRAERKGLKFSANASDAVQRVEDLDVSDNESDEDSEEDESQKSNDEESM